MGGIKCVGAFSCQTELLDRAQMGHWALTALSCVVPVTEPGSDSANASELGFLFRAVPEVFCKSITWPRAEGNW